MTDIEFKEEVIDRLIGIESVLREIRDKPAKPPTKPRQASANADGSAAINVEQPRQIIENAADVLIHFGFNKDDCVAQVDANGGLGYFLTRWKPKPMDGMDGKLWRNDELLWNAVRTYWHRKQGTLVGDPLKPEVREPATPNQNAKTDSDVPF